MNPPAEKAIVIGMDGASMELVSRMMEEGHMPHLASLAKNGVQRPMVGVFPTLTPPGWTATATGSWPGTHEVMDFNIRKLGGRLDETVWGINTGLSKSEYLWNTIERAGRKPILVKWEMSWPPTVTDGVQVEGTGPGVSNVHQIAGYHLFVSGRWAPRPIGGQRDPETLDPSALQKKEDADPVNIESAEDKGWINPPMSYKPPHEVQLTVKPLTRGRSPRGHAAESRTYYGLIHASSADTYDKLSICRSRDGHSAVAELAVGEWSAWWRETFAIDGEEIEGYVQAKLMAMTPTLNQFELFMPQIWPAVGYTAPVPLSLELDQKVGNFLQNPARDALGLVDDDTYFELLDFHHQRLADMAEYLAGSRAWDILFVESHAPDYASHFFLSQADEVSGAPAHIRARCREGLERTFRSVDGMIGRLMALADSDTVCLVVSDHGGTPNQHRAVEVSSVLEETGFLTHKQQGGEQVVDWERTIAADVGLVHIFINLKGREPTGIVTAEEYRQTQLDIIAALNGYVDEETGLCPFALAVTREDAEMLNLWGELVGDVVYALRPEFDGAHGKQLPSAQLGIGGQHCTFIMGGAGVRSDLKLRRQVRAVDVAPTLCYLLGVPMPRDVEGGVVYEALEDPDWHLSQ